MSSNPLRENPKLSQFVSLFLAKNAQINLSAIRDEEGVWAKHIEDSLIVIPLLQSYLEQKAKSKKSSIPMSLRPEEQNEEVWNELKTENWKLKTPFEILDLWTGGWFPGIPLAIMFPECHFTLLDGTRKKIDCVREFADTLGLTNVTPQWGRTEDLRSASMKEERKHNKNGIVFMDGTPTTSNHFDLVVTRATAYIEDLFTWIKPLLKADGRAWLYKQASEEEWADGQQLAKNRGFTLKKILTYELAGQERWILEITKN